MAGPRCPSCEELTAENQALKARLTEVERAVEELRRAGKRQSAPFSKGAPEPEPSARGARRANPMGAMVTGLRRPPSTGSWRHRCRTAARTAASASSSSDGTSSLSSLKKRLVSTDFWWFLEVLRWSTPVRGEQRAR